MKQFDIKTQRREEAETRNVQWASKTFEQQIDYLDNLFGKDKGAAKQRSKISAKMKIRDAKGSKK
jgi:hypothetical protein